MFAMLVVALARITHAAALAGNWELRPELTFRYVPEIRRLSTTAHVRSVISGAVNTFEVNV